MNKYPQSSGSPRLRQRDLLQRVSIRQLITDPRERLNESPADSRPFSAQVLNRSVRLSEAARHQECDRENGDINPCIPQPRGTGRLTEYADDGVIWVHVESLLSGLL